MSRRISKCVVHYSLKIHYFMEKRIPQYKKLLTNCHFPVHTKKEPASQGGGLSIHHLQFSLKRLFFCILVDDFGRRIPAKGD
jgi:hypothetical protein